MEDKKVDNIDNQSWQLKIRRGIEGKINTITVYEGNLYISIFVGSDVFTIPGDAVSLHQLLTLQLRSYHGKPRTPLKSTEFFLGTTAQLYFISLKT